MKVFEHCIYRNDNDTRRFELTFTQRDDGVCHLLFGMGFYADPMLYSTFELGDRAVADKAMSDLCKAFEGDGMTYSALPLEEVA